MQGNGLSKENSIIFYEFISYFIFIFNIIKQKRNIYLYILTGFHNLNARKLMVWFLAWLLNGLARTTEPPAPESTRHQQWFNWMYVIQWFGVWIRAATSSLPCQTGSPGCGSWIGLVTTFYNKISHEMNIFIEKTNKKSIVNISIFDWAFTHINININSLYYNWINTIFLNNQPKLDKIRIIVCTYVIW